MSPVSRIKYLPILILLIIFPVLHDIASAEQLVIVDDEGYRISFSKPFSRIISLYPAHTENLVSLGALDSLIGVSTSDSYPAEISSINRFSYHDNTEKFLAARPELILIRPMISRSKPELIQKLRESGITIVSLQPTSVDQMFDYWHKLGLMTGNSVNAANMRKTFNQSIFDLQKQIPQDLDLRPRVYFESIHRKMKTFSPDAISMFALTSGGGRNVATDAVGRNNSNIAPYGKEKILSLAPSIDIFLSQVGRMNRIQLEDIYTEPGFKLIKAVQTKSVYLIEEELVSRPTMRLLDGIRKIQQLLYPETTS